MSEDYWVRDSLESYDGGSGWDEEWFGPFTTEELAQAKANELTAEGYTSSGGDRPEHRLVEVVRPVSIDDKSGTPGSFTILTSCQVTE